MRKFTLLLAFCTSCIVAKAQNLHPDSILDVKNIHMKSRDYWATASLVGVKKMDPAKGHLYADSILQLLNLGYEKYLCLSRENLNFILTTKGRIMIKLIGEHTWGLIWEYLPPKDDEIIRVLLFDQKN